MCWNFVKNVYKLAVLSNCCSLMRGCIAFGPTKLTFALDISFGSEAA